MALTTVAKLQPGARVAEDVENVNGMLLIPKGTILTEHHIEALLMWGVELVRVAGQESEDGADPSEIQPPPEIITQAEEQLRLRFRHLNDNLAAVRILKKSAILRHARGIMIKKEPTQP